MTNDIAIAHGHLASIGGAERVAIELARMFEAPIYALRVDDTFVPEDIEAVQILDERAERWFQDPDGFPQLPRTLFWFGKHLHTAVRGAWVPALREYDTVIITKNDLQWYQPGDEQTVMQYLHSPRREHYAMFHERGRSKVRRVWSTVMRTLHASRPIPNMVVCNSEVTKERARTAVGVPDDRLTVVHPPVSVSACDPTLSAGCDPYYLSFGRLAVNKRVDEVAEAFAEREERLLIAGDGPRRDEVERAAAGADNVEVLGWVDDARKRELMAGAKALVMHAVREDFGIVPIEAMASGTPVIGVDEPFTNKQILDGRNGLVYGRGELGGAVARFERQGVKWSADQLARFADRWFGVNRFRDQMREVVEQARKNSAIQPPWLNPQEGLPESKSVQQPALSDGGTDDE